MSHFSRNYLCNMEYVTLKNCVTWNMSGNIIDFFFYRGENFFLPPPRMDPFDFRQRVIISHKFLLGILSPMSKGLPKIFFLKKKIFFCLMWVAQKKKGSSFSLIQIWRNFQKSRFPSNLKSLYRALECSYDIETVWNRKSLKNWIFLLWQPFSYDQ